MLEKPYEVKPHKKYSRKAKCCCCLGVSVLGALAGALILWGSMNSDDSYRAGWP